MQTFWWHYQMKLGKDTGTVAWICIDNTYSIHVLYNHTGLQLKDPCNERPPFIETTLMKTWYLILLMHAIWTLMKDHLFWNTTFLCGDLGDLSRQGLLSPWNSCLLIYRNLIHTYWYSPLIQNTHGWSYICNISMTHPCKLTNLYRHI